ncbi:ABC transporter permease [Clostridium polynesiense]|uniref:ABC transporter permease n=1 Tax=Clostridium polynesiense TaxID=1325933 RepID=UPI00058E23BC|nr:iron export ABC transporter permease subunit FetB [Clostridium polynesiense]
MEGAVDLSLFQLLSAYLFIVILLLIVRIKGISREKEIIIGSIRMTLQLILTGYILGYLFENPHPMYSLTAIIVMEVFSIYNIIKRIKAEIPMKLKRVIALSMFFGSFVTILFFILAVIRVAPWYNPRYFVPIAGMLIGNAMTGVSLGVSSLVDGMQTNRELVEGALMLGATPHAASKRIIDTAFDSAILPTINSMVGMGIVFLPGMMTGQILSGTSPLTAIEYQIAIMLGITGSVSLSVILVVQLGYKAYFNKEKQLI